MDKRELVQKLASQALIHNDFNNSLLDLYPRLGKCKIVLDALSKFSYKTLIIVPTTDIKTSWLNEIIKWNYKGNIEIICKASLPNIENSDIIYDVVLLDEVNELSFNNICSLIAMRQRGKIKRLCGMSGSISTKNKKDLKLFLKLEVVMTEPISKGIKDGIIADYEIILVPVKLNRTEQQQYNEITAKFEKVKQEAVSNPRLNHVKKLVAGERARLIYNFQSKIDRAAKLVDEHERCMIFTCSVPVAEQLATSHHGKNKKNNNLELFIKGEINKLAVAKLANAGVTIPNLKVGIIHQLQSNQNTAIQRILRMCNLEDKRKARIYVLYYEGTVDEDWLLSALQPMQKEKIFKLKE